MDVYALNNWDATIYMYGINLINLLFGSPVWKSMVVIFTVYAAMRFLPEVKSAPNIPGQLLKRVGAIILFSALTLWPVSWPINVYTISKAENYTNVFKWVLPVDRDDRFTADLYLSAEAQVPVVVALTGEVLGYLQFWTMWLVDKAGRTLGTDTVGKGLMHTAKLMTLQKEVSRGLDSVVADLQEEGSWTPEDQRKYAELNSAVRDFFSMNCVAPDAVEQAWEETITEGASGKSIDYFLDHLNPNLTSDQKAACTSLGQTIKNTTQDFCNRWSSATGDPPEICGSMAEVSFWKSVKNFFGSLVDGIKELPDRAIEFALSNLKDLIVGILLAAAGLVNFIFLAGITSVAPISLGIINLLIFFLSPLFFLTQLVQGNYASATVRIILEMLWARLLYAVFVLAYVIVCVLQGPAWKALLGALGLSGSLLTSPTVAVKLASKLGTLALKGGGYVLLMFFTHTALTLAAGAIVMWFGAQVLRTIIFGEFLHITQVLSSGRDFVQKRVSFKGAGRES